MGRLRFQEDGHRYFLDDRPIPSNTEVLAEEGIIDKAFYDIAGRERGTRVHLACWYADEGRLDWETVAPEERPYVRAFEAFKRETEWVTDINELPTWGSPGFGTRLDLLGVGIFQIAGVFARRRAVIDIKSGHVPAWVDLQTAGQMVAVKERIQAQDEPWAQTLEYVNGHPYPELRFALQLRKDGTYRLKQFDDPHAEDAFRGIIHQYHWKLRNGLHKEK